jgi:hypothetical protein
MSLINTMSSSKQPSCHHQGNRPWKCWLWNVCFLEVVLPENYQSKFISLETTAFVWLTKQMPCTHSYYCKTALLFSLRGLCLSEFIITMTFSSSEMKQESIHGPKFICYSNVGAERAFTKTNSQDFIPRFVKKRNWNVRNLEKNIKYTFSAKHF